ncbi:hypothetical protein PRIPAC_74937, partial [Pristionchus pacificus]
MADTPRSGSLPLLNEANDVQNVLNPAYSGSMTTSARYSTHQDIIEMEIEMGKPTETSSMKRIKDLEAIIDIAIISVPENITQELGTEISSTTQTTLSSTTITPPIPSEESTSSTIDRPSTPLTEYSQEDTDAFRNFIKRFNRTYSEKGLDNYIANMECFSTGSADIGETQFADLSETQLRKLLNPMRDPKRNDTSKRCGIHTYIVKYQNNVNIGIKNEKYINGSILYD